MKESSNNSDTSKIPSLGGGGAVEAILHLADNALIIGHRNSEWCGHGPVLEQDIAITNISLDLIGQARNFYQYAASLIGNDSNEDKLAYLREVGEFKNCLLVELPRGDWAFTVLRQFFFSAYQFYLYQQLQQNKDEQLAAIAAKSLKEVTYHLRWSSEWIIRLGDGTEESHSRIVKALDELWPYTSELFLPAPYEEKMGVDISSIKDQWIKKINEILSEATLTVPSPKNEHTGGKQGRHTEHLNDLLKDLQYLQRTYPGMEW
jgi:ring-1,2-phenylacetyl-CoA epoxidase subunit PaaC